MAAMNLRALSRSATFMIGLPIAGTLVLAFFVRDFIAFALNANFILNMGILLVLLIAIVIGVMRARLLDAELVTLRKGFAIAERRSAAPLESLPPGITGSMFLRLRRIGLLSGAHLSEESIDSEIQTIWREFEMKLEGLTYLVGLLIGLGLLGTFIGLLETLIRAGDVLDLIGRGTSSQGGGDAVTGMFSQMVTALRGPLTAMGTAFSASMFGLAGSLIAGLMVLLLRRSFESIVRRARYGLVRLSDASVASLEPTVNVTEQFLARFLTSLTEHNSRAARMLGQILEESARLHPAMSQSIAAIQMLAERVERQNEMLVRLPETLQRLERLPEAIDGSNQQLVRLNAYTEAQGLAIEALGSRIQVQADTHAQQGVELRAALELQIGLLRGIESSQGRLIDAGQRAAASLSAVEAAQRPAAQASAQIADSLRAIEANQKPLLDAASRIGVQLETVGRDLLQQLEEALALVRALRGPLSETLQSLSGHARRSAEAGESLLGGMPEAVGRLEGGLAAIQQRLLRGEELLHAQSALVQGGLDREETRAATMRLLGDALLSSAGSVDAVRHEVAGLVGSQRQVSSQLADTLKGLERVLGRLHDLFESQRLVAGVQSRRAPPGEAQA